MAMFAHRYYTPEPSLTGLFRLIDDFDRHASAQAASTRSRHCRRQAPAFSPKFDVKETETAYELQGELPGLEKQNVQIEFTDPQTLSVRGKVERTFTAGTPPAAPAAQVEDVAMSGALEESEEADADDAVVIDHEEASDTSSHHATVEDAPEDDATEETATVQETPATTTAEVAQPEAAAKPAEEAPQQPKARYWVSERSIGEFARSFHFPTRVDTDAVSASLENGLLTVTVPKAKKHESRPISVF